MKKIAIIMIVAVASFGACKKEQKDYAVAFNGIVNFVQGTVTFEKDGKSGAVKAGDMIAEGTKVITKGEKSLADIYLNDNAVRVSGNSSIMFSKMVLSKSGTATELSLEKGGVFAKVTTKLEKGDSFNVKTPIAIAAVRGTDFYVEDKGGKSNIACLDGKVEVSDYANASKSVVIGQKEEVDFAGSDLVKKQISDDKMRILKNLSDIKDIQDNIKQKYDEQRQDIRRKFEEQREEMRKAVRDQKDKDKEMVENQKASDKKRVEDQKATDKANIDAIKGTTNDAAKSSVDAAKSAMDASKTDVSSAKKAADDAKASVKPKIDPNQFKTNK